LKNLVVGLDAKAIGTQSPFADLPNVVLTPHISGMALESRRLVSEWVVDLVSAHQSGRLREELTPVEITELNVPIEDELTGSGC